MRRPASQALLAALFLLAAPARPAAAQLVGASTTTYRGCSVYFCLALAQAVSSEPNTIPDMPTVPFLYSYWMTGEVTFLPAATAAGVTRLAGTIYLPLGEEFDAGQPFTVTPDQPTFEASQGGARLPVPPITSFAVDVYNDDPLFRDHVEGALVATPEPATLALVGAGLVLLGAVTARPRRARRGRRGPASSPDPTSGPTPS